MNTSSLGSGEKTTVFPKIPSSGDFKAVKSSNPSVSSREEYENLWRYSVDHCEPFWDAQAQMIPWISPYTTVWERADANDFVGTWFNRGKLNVTSVCVDRWTQHHSNKTALIWVGEEETQQKSCSRQFSYQELSDYISQCANYLKQCGVRKGSRVGIWMPMIPEALVTQFACAKLGAVAVVVFSGFSAANAEERFLNAGCDVIVTADGGRRRGKLFPLRDSFSSSFLEHPAISTIITFSNVGLSFKSTDKDSSWNEHVPLMSSECAPEPMDAEDPLFLLYTSGTTGKPKGILHSTAGYLLYAMSTMKNVWGVHGLLSPTPTEDREVWLCTADIGWITGHSYLTYAPFALGMKVIVYEGVYTYPEPDKIYSLIERYDVSHFYTSPTLLRQLSSHKDVYTSQYRLESLRVLGTVGEAIDPTTWHWFFEQVGKSRCPIVDTYWQTETGGYLLSPIAGVSHLKPGSCSGPLFSIHPKILQEDGSEAAQGEKGLLCISQPWPGMMRSIYQDHERFKKEYLERIPGYFFTGDEAYRDADGYIWIVGRADDVIKVSGHRMGTAELEAAANSMPSVFESAAVSVPDPIKGSSIALFIVGEQNLRTTDIQDHMKRTLGPIAVPDQVFFVPDLPKTRSGKIMRRLLKNILLDQPITETSTLINPELIDELRVSIERERSPTGQAIDQR